MGAAAQTMILLEVPMSDDAAKATLREDGSIVVGELTVSRKQAARDLLGLARLRAHAVQPDHLDVVVALSAGKHADFYRLLARLLRGTDV